MITNPQSLFYIDIETAPVVKTYDELSGQMRLAWANRCERNNQEPKDEYENTASFFPELSKVVSVGMGKFEDGKFIVKAIGGDNELFILNLLAPAIEKNKVLCTHAGTYFD